MRALIERRSRLTQGRKWLFYQEIRRAVRRYLKATKRMATDEAVDLAIARTWRECHGGVTRVFREDMNTRHVAQFTPKTENH